MTGLPVTDVKSFISEGVLHAVVSRFGYNLVQIPQSQDFGTDFTLRKLRKRGSTYEDYPVFDIQLKSSSSKWRLENDEIVYELEVKAYDKMVSRNINQTTKQILIVMCLHENSDEWLLIDEELIVFQKSLFWFYTDSTKYSNNKSSVTIKIPITQIVNSENLELLVDNFAIKVIT